MNNKITLESLVMDLKRVALGYQRNSIKMADRFYEESIKRKQEVDTTVLKPYLVNILKKIELIKNEDKSKAAEDALLYCILIQNYTQKFLAISE